MNDGQWNYVYNEIQKVRAGWRRDDWYEDKPGLPDFPIMMAEELEMTLGDRLEKVEYPGDAKEPEEWFEDLEHLYGYAKERADVSKPLDRLILHQLETVIRMMGREFDLDYGGVFDEA